VAGRLPSPALLRDRLGGTPLHSAAAKRRHACMAALLAWHAGGGGGGGGGGARGLLAARNQTGHTALTLALKYGDSLGARIALAAWARLPPPTADPRRRDGRDGAVGGRFRVSAPSRVD
jgi:hypothetical protein